MATFEMEGVPEISCVGCPVIGRSSPFLITWFPIECAPRCLCIQMRLCGRNLSHKNQVVQRLNGPFSLENGPSILGGNTTLWHLLAVGRSHLCRLYPLIELRFGKQTQFYRRFLEGFTRVESLFGHLGCIVITNVGIEGRHQHEGVI